MLRKCTILLALGLLLAAPASAREYFDGTMLVSPQVFVLDYQGSTLSIHTEVPYSEIITYTIVLHGANGATITPLFTSRDSRGNLDAKFTSEDIRKIIEVPFTELTLTGDFIDNGSFSLRGTIRVQ